MKNILSAGILALMGMTFTAAVRASSMRASAPAPGAPGVDPGQPDRRSHHGAEPVEPHCQRGDAGFHRDKPHHVLFLTSRQQRRDHENHLLEGSAQFGFGSFPVSRDRVSHHHQYVSGEPDLAEVHAQPGQTDRSQRRGIEERCPGPERTARSLVRLNLDFGTYYISIKQSGAPEILWQGPLPQPTTDWIKSQPRVLLMANFFNATGTYTIDEVIMREK